MLRVRDRCEPKAFVDFDLALDSLRSGKFVKDLYELERLARSLAPFSSSLPVEDSAAIWRYCV